MMDGLTSLQAMLVSNGAALGSRVRSSDSDLHTDAGAGCVPEGLILTKN